MCFKQKRRYEDREEAQEQLMHQESTRSVRNMKHPHAPKVPKTLQPPLLVHTQVSNAVTLHARREYPHTSK